MSRLTSADDFAIQNVERGKQSGTAMALIVVRLAFWQAGPQRENGCCTIQGLNLALLVHTQYQGTVRWIQVKANNIGDLFIKTRIFGEFESLHAMRLHIGTLPHSVNDRPRDSQM